MLPLGEMQKLLSGYLPPAQAPVQNPLWIDLHAKKKTVKRIHFGNFGQNRRFLINPQSSLLLSCHPHSKTWHIEAENQIRINERRQNVLSRSALSSTFK
jgi:hypothetical protein